VCDDKQKEAQIMLYRSRDVLVLLVANVLRVRISTALRWLRWLRIFPAQADPWRGVAVDRVAVRSEAALVVAREQDGNQAEDAKDNADQEPDAGVSSAPGGGGGG
jgi:hypothetical protein